MQSVPVPGSFADKLKQAMQRKQGSATHDKRAR